MQRGIANQDGDLLRSAIWSLEDANLTESTLPEKDFQRLLRILEDPAFLQMEGSEHLIAYLERESDLEELNDDQAGRAVAAYEKAYPLIKHWFHQFSISERMSSICHDQRALDMWRRLMNLEAEQGRTFVPHGLEHLVKEGEGSVSRDALKLLLSMRNDPSECVRGEAEISLARLEKYVQAEGDKYTIRSDVPDED